MMNCLTKELRTDNSIKNTAYDYMTLTKEETFKRYVNNYIIYRSCTSALFPFEFQSKMYICTFVK